MVVGVLVTPQLMCPGTDTQQGLGALAAMATPHEEDRDKDSFIHFHVAEEIVNIVADFS